MRIRLPVSDWLLLSVVCLASIASAQTSWERTYGGAGEDEGYSVQQTNDGGFIIVGYTTSFGAGAYDVYLIKTDAQGDTLWTRTYGGFDGDWGRSVRQTTDGGYVIAGYAYTFNEGMTDVYLVKTDAQGDTLWTRTYGRSYFDNGYAVQQTTDGGYIVAGYTSSVDPLYSNAYLIKTDAQGETLWTRVYGSTGGDCANAVEQTSDGGYIIAGTDLYSGDGNFWLIKTDASGDTLWTRTYGATRGSVGQSVQQTTDSGYVIAGTMDNIWLLKIDASGDTVWSRTYGGTASCEAHSVEQTADGGYVIAGYMWPMPLERDVYLIKTDALGDTLWTRCYGGSANDEAYSVEQTSDGGYVIAGSTQSAVGEAHDVYLIKTPAGPDVGPIAILTPPGIAESGSVYVPSVIVRNFGLTSPAFPVTMSIGSSYYRTAQETLACGLSDTVTFPSWAAGPVGALQVRCFTALGGDEDPANDTIRGTIQVLPPPWHDVGAVAIISPPGSVRAGDTVIPRARIRNFGNRAERYFDVRFCIGASYNQKVNVVDALPADSTAEIAFPPWVAEVGNWTVSCSTMLASDVNPANDKVSSSVRVVPLTLAIEPDQAGHLASGQSKTYQFCALIQGDTGAVVEIARPSAPPGWSARLCNAAGAQDLTDTDGDGIPDLGYVAPAGSGWFSLDVTAPSGTRGDTASLGQVMFLVAGHVGDRPDIADTAVLTLTLVPELSIHNFPNPFSTSTSFVLGLPEDGKASLTVYTRTGERVCRVLTNADLPAGVHVVRWDGVNDNGRSIAPGTYEYLLDYMHAGKTERIHKKLVVTKQ